jgi:transposase
MVLMALATIRAETESFRTPNKTLFPRVNGRGERREVKNAMAKEMLSDELWAVLEPLIPPPPPRPQGGRTRVPNRATLTGILFVLKSGIPWEFLPPEMGCGSGMTCWRRLQEWQGQGVWRKVHRRLLDVLGEADRIDWTRAVIDSATVPAPGGAKRPGRIRRIAANRARSAMLWSTTTGSRWPLSSRGPMSRMGR